MSGYLTLEKEPLTSEANKDTPLLICHGEVDQVVGTFRYSVRRCARQMTIYMLLPTLASSGSMFTSHTTKSSCFVQSCLGVQTLFRSCKHERTCFPGAGDVAVRQGGISANEGCECQSDLQVIPILWPQLGS